MWVYRRRPTALSYRQATESMGSSSSPSSWSSLFTSTPQVVSSWDFGKHHHSLVWRPAISLGKKRWGVALDFHDLSRDMKIVHLMCRISAINSNRIARILQRWEKKTSAWNWYDKYQGNASIPYDDHPECYIIAFWKVRENEKFNTKIFITILFTSLSCLSRNVPLFFGRRWMTLWIWRRSQASAFLLRQQALHLWISKLQISQGMLWVFFDFHVFDKTYRVTVHEYHKCIRIKPCLRD